MASAPSHLQSMMLTLQRYSFSVECRWDFPSTLLTAFLMHQVQKKYRDESTMNWFTWWVLKKTTQNFQVSENLLCRKSELKQAQIRHEQKALCTFIKTGWQNDKASVPGFWVSTLDCSSWNRPFAVKPSRDLLFIKLWAAALRMPEMGKECRKHQNGQV